MSAHLSLDLAARLWRCVLPRGVSKLVLQCFCHHINNESGLCWPSIARVALMCGLSERAVQGHVRRLVTAGILRPRLRIGHATRYTVHLDALAPLVFRPTPGAGASWPAEPWPGVAVPAEPQPAHAGAGDNAAPTPAAFAAPPAENAPVPPQLSTPTPAESAPITVFNFKENIEGTGAPALSAAPVLIEGVAPEILADFAAIRKTKRKGPVTAAVIEEICQQAHLAGLTLAQALQTCCDPRRRWARFEAGWLRPAPGGWAGGAQSANAAHTASSAAPLTTPAPWQPPVFKPAAPEVVAVGRARLQALRQSIVGAGAGCGASKGWAHAAIEKHQSGQPVRRAVLLNACAALKLDPASLSAGRMH